MAPMATTYDLYHEMYNQQGFVHFVTFWFTIFFQFSLGVPLEETLYGIMFIEKKKYFHSSYFSCIVASFTNIKLT